MTAPRTCRACGADLPGDVRWCVRCYEPARELTPRAPVWAPGEFVDTPIVTKGPVAHWSRWEKSATTFGPVGRIAVTTVAVVWLLSAATQSPVTVIFVLPLVTLVIRETWRRGWVIPAEHQASRPHTPLVPVRAWLWDRSEFARTALLATSTLVGMGILLAPTNPIAKFVVIATVLVAGAWWLLSKVAGAR